MPATGEPKVREFHGWAIANGGGHIYADTVRSSRVEAIAAFDKDSYMGTFAETRKEYKLRAVKITITARGGNE